MVSSLQLRNCGSSLCSWASRLSVVSSLADLNLSYSSIEDEGFSVICTGLHAAYSIRHLNLSYNKFGGKPCVCVSKMLVENRSLFSLDLSGNDMHHEVYTAIGMGLIENNILMDLLLQRCNLPVQAAMSIRSALEVNSTCQVHLDFNPLPDTFRWDSRGLVLNEQSAAVVESHRSAHDKKDRESQLKFKKREMLMDQLEIDQLAIGKGLDDNSSASGCTSLRETGSIDYDDFSADLHVWSESDKEREHSTEGARAARSR